MSTLDRCGWYRIRTACQCGKEEDLRPDIVYDSGLELVVVPSAPEKRVCRDHGECAGDVEMGVVGLQREGGSSLYTPAIKEQIERKGKRKGTRKYTKRVAGGHLAMVLIYVVFEPE